jgi:GDPmannose 4,6-dehydratase
MFGNAMEAPQNEDTPFHPRSPYGISKVAGFHLTRNYRESYNIFACNGILFNHESPRRGFEFVTRKITNHAAKIKLGMTRSLQLGNLDARRDWGYAGDYVEAMWLMLQHNAPDDYVIATGKSHSVRDFVQAAFEYLDLNYLDYIAIDEKLYRPSEVNLLMGDSRKAKSILGWQPRVKFTDLVEMMVRSDLDQMK